MVLQQRLQRECRVYGERELDRKMREDRLRWPVVGEESPSDRMCRTVRSRHLLQIMRTAKLTHLERRVFILGLNGASLRQVASVLGVSNQRACCLVSVIGRKLRRARDDKYYGLHEVYWKEVRRYTYRRPAYSRAGCIEGRSA